MGHGKRGSIIEPSDKKLILPLKWKIAQSAANIRLIPSTVDVVFIYGILNEHTKNKRRNTVDRYFVISYSRFPHFSDKRSIFREL